MTYPEISIDLHLGDEQVDLVSGGFDLWLQEFRLADSGPGATPLPRPAAARRGAPAYFARRGRPAHPRELAGHACLAYAYLPNPDRSRFLHASGEEETVTPVAPSEPTTATHSDRP